MVAMDEKQNQPGSIFGGGPLWQWPDVAQEQITEQEDIIKQNVPSVTESRDYDDGHEVSPQTYPPEGDPIREPSPALTDASSVVDDVQDVTQKEDPFTAYSLRKNVNRDIRATLVCQDLLTSSATKNCPDRCRRHRQF